MEPEIRALLDELAREGAENDAREADRRLKRLNLEPETARLVSLFIRIAGARRVLEIGTSNGYSTIWLAWTARRLGGQVVTVEREAAKQAEARENLRRVGLDDLVDFRCGDATEVVRGLDGGYDAIFFDADRFSAPDQLRLLLPRLPQKALLLADNALSHPEEIAGYLELVESLPDFDHTVIPVGKGLSVASRT